jgi:hypothetical protein
LAETVFENGSIFSAEKNPYLARVIATDYPGILEFSSGDTRVVVLTLKAISHKD